MSDLLIKTGEIKIDIGGRVRTLKFGMRALQVVQRMTTATATDAPPLDLADTATTLALPVYAGIMARKDDNDLPAGFSVETVIDWLDDVSDDDLAAVLALSEESFNRLPNVAARVDGLLGRVRDETGNLIGTTPANGKITSKRPTK